MPSELLFRESTALCFKWIDFHVFLSGKLWVTEKKRKGILSEASCQSHFWLHSVAFYTVMSHVASSTDFCGYLTTLRHTWMSKRFDWVHLKTDLDLPPWHMHSLDANYISSIIMVFTRDVKLKLREDWMSQGLINSSGRCIKNYKLSKMESSVTTKIIVWVRNSAGSGTI